MDFLSFFSEGTGQKHMVEERVIEYVMSYILRDDLIRQYIEKYKKTRELKDQDKERALISVYLDLEHFISSNSFPIVKEQLANETLQKRILEKFEGEDFKAPFSFILLSHKKRVEWVFQEAINLVTTNIIQNIGAKECWDILENFKEEPVLRNLKWTDDDLDYSGMTEVLDRITVNELAHHFKILYILFYEKILRNFGLKTAESLVHHSFQKLKDTYGSDYTSYFLEIIPDGIMDKERYGYLSREELERRVVEITQSERDKRKLAEHLTKQLEQKIREVDMQKNEITHLLAESQNLEEKLKGETSQLNSIVESMGEGLLVVDLAHKITLINPAAQTLLGVEAKDVIGKRWSDIVTAYDEKGNKIPLQERSFAKSVHKNNIIVTNVDANHYYKSYSGKIFPVASTTTPLVTDNIIVGAVKVFQDISQEKESKTTIRKEVERQTKELRLQQARIFASLNSVEQGFIITDTKATVLFTNQPLSKIMKAPQRKWSFEDLCMQLKDTLDIVEFYHRCMNEKQAFVLKDLTYQARKLRMFFTPIYLDEQNKSLIGVVIVVEEEIST